MKRWQIGMFGIISDEILRNKIRKYQENLKTSKNDVIVPSLPTKMKIVLILAKKHLKNRN